jgi:SAM-dependent methyltransferase
MDEKTIKVYNEQAGVIAARHRARAHSYLHELVQQFFVLGGCTADIGCGSGRDTAWLVSQGFPTVGYDASEGMLEEARAACPGLDLRIDSLPELASITDGQYQNVLSSAVIMHLPAGQLSAAVRSLARILLPGGRLALSYRGSGAGAEREEDGRLFTPINPEALTRMLETAGLRILLSNARPDTTRERIVWRYVAAERSANRG